MGGHGGLNILPQKTWNVYRRDNRDKVETDEEMLRAAKQAQAQCEQSADLQSKMQSLKAPESCSHVGLSSKSDQELFLSARREKRRQEKEKAKEISEMVKDPRMIGEDGHFNLFLNEEYEMQEKQKLRQAESVEGKNVYLKRTGNLGEIVRQDKQWYQGKAEVHQVDQTKAGRQEEEEKRQMAIGLKFARMNADKEFGKVVILDKHMGQHLEEDGDRHTGKEKKEKKSKKEKKHKKDKKKEKEKKEKKEFKRKLKEQKLREIEALIDYQNRKNK